MGRSNGEITMLERSTVFTNGTHKFRHPMSYSSDNISFGQIIYHEFRGFGAPSEGIGDPGDVYIDLTPERYALYFMKDDDWTQWYRVPREIVSGRGHTGIWNELAHPFLADTYLFVGDGGILWATRDTIRHTVHSTSRILEYWEATACIERLLAKEERTQQSSRTESLKRCADDHADGSHGTKRIRIDDPQPEGSNTSTNELRSEVSRLYSR